MSERMDDDALDRYYTDGADDIVYDEAKRARASENAKDKEIERLKADNAALLGLIIGMEEGDADEMMRAKLIIRNRDERPGATLLEELARLRAQVATLKNERPSLAVGSQGEPSSETPGRE